MTEFLGGVPMGRGDESRPETEMPPVGALSEAIIRTYCEPDYAGDGVPRMFRDHRWEDPDEYGKHYWLQQISLPGVIHVHSYNLRVFAEEHTLTEWYKFQTYDSLATPCDGDGRAVGISYQDMLNGSRKARNYLRLAMAGVPIPSPCIAPPDRIPGSKLTDLENDVFIDLAGRYVLSLIEVGLVYQRTLELPKHRSDEAVERLTYALQRRPAPPNSYGGVLGINRKAHLRLKPEWIPHVVNRALFGDELDQL